MQTTILIAKSYGQANVLEYSVQELPALGAGMARIEVRAAGIGSFDARRMTGEYRDTTLPLTFGVDFAGVIVDVDSNLSKWSVGNEVLGIGGTYTHATIIDVPVTNLIARPKSLEWKKAGSLAGAAQTALTILDEIGDVKSLLIHGASGGVGSITIQLARERGIDVVATASKKNEEYLKMLGAVPVIYGPGLAVLLKNTRYAPFDASIDMAGTDEATMASLQTVKRNGFIGSIAGRKLSSPLVQAVCTKKDHVNLQYVVDGVAEGKFRWEIDNFYPFEKADEAYIMVLKGHARGKSVLVF